MIMMMQKISLLLKNSYPPVYIRFFSLLSLVIFCFLTAKTAAVTVVLDPGHGGKDISPVSLYGDKYDPRLVKYLDRFREGARYKGVWENETMYDIAVQAKQLLDLTTTTEGKTKFSQILKKYGIHAEKVEEIQAFLSRPPGYSETYFAQRDDFNAGYRLYDYPDIKTDQIQRGTISRINALKPELVVTLHLTHTESHKNGGLATVMTPGYRTYNLARQFVSGDKKSRKQIKKKFQNSPYRYWFISEDKYDHFYSFMCDAWIYYTGYWSKRNGLETDYHKYRGFRQNFFTWAYAEPEDITGSITGKSGRYATHLKNFRPEGPFWEREMSEPEDWRREAGDEGYGGDNFYASQELLRFMRKALLVNKKDSFETLPRMRPPYLSTWAVPTYVNAVSAYLEIAHTTSKKDYNRMLKQRNVYAEAVAAGVYSLFFSSVKTVNVSQKKKNLPWQKPVNFEKYRTYKNGNYFTSVVQ